MNITITAKGKILFALTDMNLDFNEGQTLLNEFAEVMGPGIFDGLLTMLTPTEAAVEVLQWKKEQVEEN